MLATIGVTLTVVVAAIFAFLVLLMVLPLRLDAQVNTANVPAVMMRIQPLGRLAPWIAIPAGGVETKTKPSKRKRKRRSSALMHRMAFAAPSLIAELIATVRIEQFWGVVDFGLEDPSETGTVFGYATPLTYGVLPSAGGTFILRPDFDGPRFDAEGRATVQIVPIALVPPFVRFAWRVWGR